MRVPLSWLKEYVSLDGIAVTELADRLTTAGMEVANIEYIGLPGPEHAAHLVWDPETIRVGEIVAVEPHPNADRLRLVTVVYGASEPRTVVTGAPNIRAGQRVAYATIGAKVINGYSDAREQVTLEPKKLRGILSQGMVLSERELGLSDTHEGIMDLPEDAPVGEPLRDYLGDIVLDIELTPNLVGRAASIVGIAREVAALFDRPLQEPAPVIEATGPAIDQAVRVEIEVPDVNPRFTATLIRGVTVEPSPAWMQRRLTLAGMRPINNIVDITNYVMLELGQPLHAFDYDRLVERAQGSGAEVPTIIMRLAREDERLVTLDDVDRKLHPHDILVTDTAGILSLAGIMGGAETEVSADTSNVLLEAAAWDFISIRRTASHNQLFSEAAYRFSRGVHPEMALRGNLRAMSFMAELGGGEVASGVIDVYPRPPSPVVVELELRTVNRLLGTALTTEEVAGYLQRLQFRVERQDGSMRVIVPDHREDVTIPADLVEEVARVHGLDNLPMTLLADALPPMRPDRELQLEERIRDLLVGAGLTETISYALTAPERDAELLASPDAEGDVSDDGYIRLANPISQERRVMRRNLLVSAMETLQTNLRHRARVTTFEIGLVYLDSGEALPREERRVVIVMTGPLQRATWATPASPPMDYYSVKGVLDELLQRLHLSEQVRYAAGDHPSLQPGRVADVMVGGRRIGYVGELHPVVRRAHGLPEQRVAVADLSLDQLIEAVPASFTLLPIPRYPAVVQDIAVVVPESTPAGEVEQVIRAAGAERLAHVELFDLYRGKPLPDGMKSLAYTLRYSHPEKTLVDEEVAAYHAAITEALRKKLGAKIRGEDA